jgi:hypothetical protein
MPIELSPDHQPLTAGSFERIKSREFVPERTLTGLKLFRERPAANGIFESSIEAGLPTNCSKTPMTPAQVSRSSL